MCGIAGLISFRSPAGPELICRMIRALRHRGPDDEGYVAVDTEVDPVRAIPFFGQDSRIQGGPIVEDFAGRFRLYLGHRRLAILDVSSAGHQPMFRDGLWIVFNGEIYNYIELRQELKAAGRRFKTDTDTEVILAAYDLWGEQCIHRFNGDWAFCLLDARRRVLLLSRDRYGVKPLYFFRDSNHFAFASEIKALLHLPFVPRLLNKERAFDHCFLLSRDHTEQTLFEGVYQLMPGHNISIDMLSGKLRKSRYYSVSCCPDLGIYDHRTARKCAADVRELLIDSVKIRLRADVPVGTCLSGGLDSSAIVAITAKLLGEDLNTKIQNTFTAIFPGEQFDESRFAQSVIERSGAISHWVCPSEDGYARALDAILYHQDEPFGGTSIYAQWEVMLEASKHVKVVLDGQGGDEVFGGYRDYHTSFLANLFFEWRFAFIKEMFLSIAKANGFRKGIEQLKVLAFFLLGASWKRRVYCLRHQQDLALATHFGDMGQHALEHIDRKFGAKVNELLSHYLTTYSLPHLLKYEDRNSMAHSIEARVPFTDHRIVDYMFSIPAIYKIRHGWTKWLLRLALKDLLPAEILWRKDKIGFVAPPWASRRDIWAVWMQRNFTDDKELNLERGHSTLSPAQSLYG